MCRCEATHIRTLTDVRFSGSFYEELESRDSFLIGEWDESGQVTKGKWWMSRRWEAMKDVVSCDKPGGAAHKRIPGSPNGTTQSGAIQICTL